MRRLVLATITLAALGLAGCPAKPKNGECKSSDDCAEQTGYGKVCVQGRCQECATDADCKDGFACQANKCAPKAAADADAKRRADEEAEARRRAAAEEEARRQAAAAAAAAASAECADAGAFTIRFGFDQSTLVPEAQATLRRLADCLKKAPAKKVGIAGHCDERGTTQYNIALGARRAEAARKYLADLGVQGALDTVSFGKEKPLCGEQTEECWARNRRAEFQVAR